MVFYPIGTPIQPESSIQTLKHVRFSPRRTSKYAHNISNHINKHHTIINHLSLANQLSYSLLQLQPLLSITHINLQNQLA